MQPLDISTDESFRTFLPGAQQEDDRSLIATFSMRKKLMGARSEAEKRPIYEDREFITIIIKGQQHGIFFGEVADEHRRRFPIAYAAFKAGQTLPMVGTPIEMLPGLGPSQAHHLVGLHIRSIEDLANVTEESTLSRIGMGGRELVRRAQAFIGQAGDRAAALEAKLAEEQEARRKDREEFEERLRALEAKTPVRKAPKKRVAKPTADAPDAPE